MRSGANNKESAGDSKQASGSIKSSMPLDQKKPVSKENLFDGVRGYRGLRCSVTHEPFSSLVQARRAIEIRETGNYISEEGLISWFYIGGRVTDPETNLKLKYPPKKSLSEELKDEKVFRVARVLNDAADQNRVLIESINLHKDELTDEGKQTLEDAKEHLQFTDSKPTAPAPRESCCDYVARKISSAVTNPVLLWTAIFMTKINLYYAGKNCAVQVSNERLKAYFPLFDAVISNYGENVFDQHAKANFAVTQEAQLSIKIAEYFQMTAKYFEAKVEKQTTSTPSLLKLFDVDNAYRKVFLKDGYCSKNLVVCTKNLRREIDACNALWQPAELQVPTDEDTLSFAKAYLEFQLDPCILEKEKITRKLEGLEREYIQHSALLRSGDHRECMSKSIDCILAIKENRRACWFKSPAENGGELRARKNYLGWRRNTCEPEVLALQRKLNTLKTQKKQIQAEFNKRAFVGLKR